LLLRHDNAEERLLEMGYQIGCVSKDRYDQYCQKRQAIEQAKDVLSQTHVKADPALNAYLTSLGFTPTDRGMKEIDLLKRPKVTIDGLSSITGVNFGHFINQHIEIDVKYKGYIEKAKRDARHLQEMESVALPDDLDYAHMENISLEARQKLDAVRPQTLGQASRISGINPSDIAVLAMKVR